MDLSEFLLARIADDEAEAQALSDPLPGTYLGAYDEAGVVVVNAARVLAECEAKRRIVEAHQPYWADDGDAGLCAGEDGRFRMSECPTLTALALPYADHPDYRPEWKP